MWLTTKQCPGICSHEYLLSRLIPQSALAQLCKLNDDTRELNDEVHGCEANKRLLEVIQRGDQLKKNFNFTHEPMYRQYESMHA